MYEYACLETHANMQKLKKKKGKKVSKHSKVKKALKQVSFDTPKSNVQKNKKNACVGNLTKKMSKRKKNTSKSARKK